jgi:hypothetical protein
VAKRKDEIERRVTLLICDFKRYVRAFEENPAFARSGQLENHVRTIRLRRTLGSASAAAGDPTFLQSLYGTLQKWGIGQRGSNMVAFDDFARAFENVAPLLDALEAKAIDDPNLDLA